MDLWEETPSGGDGNRPHASGKMCSYMDAVVAVNKAVECSSPHKQQQ